MAAVINDVNNKLSEQTIKLFDQLKSLLKIDIMKLIFSILEGNEIFKKRLQATEISDFSSTLADFVVEITSSNETIGKVGEEHEIYCKASLKTILEREFNAIKSKLLPVSDSEVTQIIKNLEKSINNFNPIGPEIETIRSAMSASVFNDVLRNLTLDDKKSQQKSQKLAISAERKESNEVVKIKGMTPVFEEMRARMRIALADHVTLLLKAEPRISNYLKDNELIDLANVIGCESVKLATLEERDKPFQVSIVEFIEKKLTSIKDKLLIIQDMEILEISKKLADKLEKFKHDSKKFEDLDKRVDDYMSDEMFSVLFGSASQDLKSTIKR